ncbi:MAG: hypothetical protein Ct9H300mP1_37270 [Planctomycetaceae bacterium]|nr:MAG: hypothetical protein Ct9H300mP1_37270 [Planctomycetaceae bacterium]
MTLVEITAAHLRVRATDGDTMLGGMDWTNRLADAVAEDIIGQGGTDPREVSDVGFRLLQVCEDAKRDLSTRKGDHRAIGSRWSGVFDRSDPVPLRTRNGRSAAADPRHHRTGACPGRNFGTDLDDIVLIGGSTAMPGVRAMLEELGGKPPSSILDPQFGPSLRALRFMRPFSRHVMRGPGGVTGRR